MGLDAVELLLAFEDEFGFAIPDDEAQNMATPADVADYVISNIAIDANGACPSQVRFYRLRAVLMNSFGMTRAQIRPDSRLQDILKARVRDGWNELRIAIGTKQFPLLERTRLFLALVVFGGPLTVSGMAFAAGFPRPAIVGCYVALMLILSFVTASMGTAIPAKFQTVGSLVPFVRIDRPARWTRASVLARVIAITSEQLGIEKSVIREDSHFIRDLGLS